MRSKRFLILSVFLLLSAPLAAKDPGIQLTPIVFQVLAQPLRPVLGSDGEYHLVYEIQVTNISAVVWRVQGVKALEGTRVFGELTGSELEARIGPLHKRGGSTDLAPNQTSLLWMHLKFPAKTSLPRSFQHELNLSGADKNIQVQGAEAKVSSESALEIAPPLRGDNWVAADGCCDSIRHVRALLPVNGQLYGAQRFAIDWEMLNQDRKIFVGDPKNPENYVCYGKEVFAVADGVVTSMLDGLPNQVPGKLPASIAIEQADGNHIVMQIAPGVYALYAHLKPGSIRVKPGDRIQKGQLLAQVGNTGNTSEPHLHFHLMDGPSPLASNGLPYVLDFFELLGQAPSTQAFDKAAAEGIALPIETNKSPTEHRDQLPLDLSLVRLQRK